jgi:hypothetical protein
MNEIKTHEDLKYTPKLVELLMGYVSCMYEEYALFDHASLFSVYEELKERNALHLLFEQEFLDSPLHWVDGQ